MNGCCRKVRTHLEIQTCLYCYLWSLEDEFLVHSESGLVLTAKRDGYLYLTQRTAGLRSLKSVDFNQALDRNLGVVEKLFALFDYLKVRAKTEGKARV